MSTIRPSSTDSAVKVGDVLLSLLFLAVFAGAFLVAQDWPFKARLFPELISVTGMAFVGIKLALNVRQLRQRPGAPEPDRPDAPPAEPARVSDDDVVEDFSVEYVFATASPREWAAALAWIVAFFISLYVLGVFVTVPAFALAYLRFAGRVGWLGALLYAAVAGGVIWFVFYYLLYVPMPAGIF